MTQPSAGGLLPALQKLPATSVVSYRGLLADEGPPASTVVTKGLAATSRDPRVATENFTTSRLLAIAGRTGRDIAMLAQNPAEAEVVFLPGTIIRPVQTLSLDDGRTVHVVEELLADGSQPPATGALPESSAGLAALITNDIAAAARRPPVRITSPGKFTGALT